MILIAILFVAAVTQMKSKRPFSIILALALILVAFLLTFPAWQSDKKQVATLNQAVTPPGDRSLHSDNHALGASPASSSAGAAPADNAITRKPATSAARRSIPTDKKPVKDILASWESQPGWPEGPRLLLDVESAETRYVNLRPNEIGIMPTINTGANETLIATVHLPESTPGEHVYIELPHGGKLSGTTNMGQKIIISPERTITFEMTTDDQRGHCAVNIRTEGHTRTLPIWVGAPIIAATSASETEADQPINAE